jgi:hypothetical protein
VVEFELNRAIAMLTQDGPAEIRGHTTFEAVGTPNRPHNDREDSLHG